MTGVLDTLARPLRDLRVSITDRCNFRCTYCMPRDVYGSEHVFVPHDQILRYEEIERLTRILAGLGVRKVRITGGEPLLRRDVEQLVGMLSAVEGIDDLALTTNGSALERLAPRLADAGLHRVTVSLDALDDGVFRAMNDAGFPVERVLRGIDAALDAGLRPVKVNAVVKRGVNDDQVLPMARRFRERGCILRFIEFMDVGNTNGWRLDDVVSAAEILETLQREFRLEPVEPAYRGEVASRYRRVDGGGEIGFVTSVTRPFCADCTRLRISADGQLFTCLFAAEGHDVKALLRSDASDADIRDRIVAIWNARADRYSERRANATPSTDRIEMSYIGG